MMAVLQYVHRQTGIRTIQLSEMQESVVSESGTKAWIVRVDRAGLEPSLDSMLARRLPEIRDQFPTPQWIDSGLLINMGEKFRSVLELVFSHSVMEEPGLIWASTMKTSPL